MWSLIELLCFVVGSSIPALRPYVDPWVSRVTKTLSWGGTGRGSGGPSKVTGASSTVNSNTTFNDLKKGRGSYAMSSVSPASPTSPSGHWKELGGQGRIPQPAAVHSFHAYARSGDLESGHRSYHSGQLRDDFTSDSESDLIFQGVAVTYNVKVWSKSRDDLMDGQGLERSVSVNGTRLSTTSRERLQ